MSTAFYRRKTKMDVKMKQNSLYKRVLSVVLALAFYLTLIPVMSTVSRADVTFGGGDGLSKASAYEISTVAQLKKLADDVNSGTSYSGYYFKLANGIDLEGTESNQWEPIGTNSSNSFAGTFNGNGNEIKGLYINKPNNSFQGLFGYNAGTIENLTVSGKVTGKTNIGGIVGRNEKEISNCVNNCKVTGMGTYNIGGIAADNSGSGTIENCINNGEINSSNSSCVGGIAGFNQNNCTVINCRNTGNITGNISVGGIVGHNGSQTNQKIGNLIENCYNEGSVSGQGEVGGIAGRNEFKITNCYNLGAVSITDSGRSGGICGINVASIINCYNWGDVIVFGDGDTGGIAGYNSDDDKVTNCYYFAENSDFGGIAGADKEGKAEYKSKDDFAKQGTFNGWDFTETWRMSSFHGRPILIKNPEPEFTLSGSGTAGDPYVIDTAETLQGFAQLVNGGNSFENKFIELVDDIDLLKEGVCGKNIGSWTPIGKNKEFKGTFDGKGHKILNLYINDGTEDNAGLFGINNGTIKDLAVTGTVTGGRYAGGIVGTNKSNGKIESCSNACNVTGSSEVGGIAGFNEGGAIDNCYNTGGITGDSKVGGVAGNNDHGTIENSYSIGNITGGSNAGGIAGSNNAGTVENCYYLGSAEDGSGIGTPKTESEFKSGEVAFLLQSKQTKQVWGQKLTGNDKDDHPILTSDADTKVVEFPYPCTDSSGNELTVYTNPPETTANLPAGTTVKLGDAEVTVTNGGTVQSKDGGKMYFPDGSVAKKNGQTSNAPTGGGVYDPASDTWENGSLNDPSQGSGSGSGGSTGNPTPPPTSTTPSAGNNSDTSTSDKTDASDGISADDINVGSADGNNAVTIGKDSVGALKDEIIASHLTDEDKAAIKDGNKLDVLLSASDAADSVSDTDKQAAEAVLDGTGYTAGNYLNVDLLKQINGEEVGKLTELNSPITLVFIIPEELRKENRVFGIVRIHDGEAKFFEDTDNDPDTITIVTDRFSTYIIVYKDLDSPASGNPGTGTATPIAITGLACAVIIAAVAVKRKKIIE